MRKSLLLAIAVILVFSIAYTGEYNPFFEEYTTPFQVPPFDKIEEGHYMPGKRG